MSKPAAIKITGPARVAAAAAKPAAPKPAAAAAAAETSRLALVSSQAAPQAGAAGQASQVPLPAMPADPIGLFIELEMEARQCADLDALRFAIVNSTRKLAAYDQAFLVEPAAEADWTITRASSVATLDRNAPLPRAIAAWLAHPNHAALLQRGEARQADLGQEAKAWAISGEPFADGHALWLPIKARSGRVLSALLAIKSERWVPQQIALLQPLAGTYGHAWEALLPQSAEGLARARRYLSRKWLATAAVMLAAMAAVLPVPMSALAPAEVVAATPVLVTAPIDGVIGDIMAPPGAWVEKGAPIIRFVDVKLRNEHEVASRNVAVAEARYFRTLQAATATQKDTQDLATTRAEYDVAKAEHAYTGEMLARSEIRALSSGLLIYAAKSDWLGKPVTTGERLMEIGNPDQTEIRIEIPVSDAIALKAGGPVSLFLDGDPLRPIAGTIARNGYRPMLSAEQQLVFRVFARFDQGQAQRIGLRGVARVSGDDVPLWFYLLRRPIASVRQWIGL